MARVTKQMSDALKAAGLWKEYTYRRKNLLALGLTDYASSKILCESLLAGEAGDDVERRLLQGAGLIPGANGEAPTTAVKPAIGRRRKPEQVEVAKPVEAPHEVCDRPPPLKLTGLGSEFWKRKATPNEVVSWVVRNYMNPDLAADDFPDPSALTLLVTARKSMEMWESVFGAYQKMVSAKSGEERDDGIDGQREYDLLARFQELEAGR